MTVSYPHYQHIFNGSQAWSGSSCNIVHEYWHPEQHKRLTMTSSVVLGEVRKNVQNGSVIFKVTLDEKINPNGSEWNPKNFPDMKIDYELEIFSDITGFLHITETNSFGLRGTRHGLKIREVKFL